MAIINGNNNGGARSPEEGICDYVKVVRSAKDLSDSLTQAGQITIDSNKEVRKYKICCLDKAKTSHQTYLDIDYCVAFEQSLKTEILQKNIDSYIKKDAELEKLIKESSKLLNGLRGKIEEAHNAACSMKICINNKLFPSGDKPDTVLSDELIAIETSYTEIVEATSKINNLGQSSFDYVVTIAGINSFSNIESLKDFGTKLGDAMKTFKSCVDDNVKSTDDDVKTAQTELIKVLENLTNSHADKNAECLKTTGLESVLDFICTGECSDGSIEDLCECLEKKADPLPSPSGKGKASKHHKHSKIQSAINKD